ncbi:unnamed protein product [Caenorhabditis auriculariae]|uniref:Uncharacterized protein n=1 Tax=Caenorhabditis auriculariae TaxID=2777116 RepID=A0A8S1HHH7_9PELO|nr:unnamed protein product [Caenorhabditis auriculariae]
MKKREEQAKALRKDKNMLKALGHNLTKEQQKASPSIDYYLSLLKPDMETFMNKHRVECFDWTEYCIKRPIDWKKKFKFVRTCNAYQDELSAKVVLCLYFCVLRGNRLTYWALPEKFEDDFDNYVLEELLLAYRLTPVDVFHEYKPTVLEFMRIHGFRVIFHHRASALRTKLEHSWLLSSHGLLTAILALERGAAIKFLTLHMSAMRNATKLWKLDDDEDYFDVRQMQKIMCYHAQRCGLFYKNIIDTAIDLARSFDLWEDEMVHFAWAPSIFVEWSNRGYYVGTPALEALWNTRHVEDLHDPLAERLVETSMNRLPQYPLIVKPGPPRVHDFVLTGVSRGRAQQLTAFNRRSEIKAMLALDGKKLVKRTKIYEQKFDSVELTMKPDQLEEKWMKEIREKVLAYQESTKEDDH